MHKVQTHHIATLFGKMHALVYHLQPQKSGNREFERLASHESERVGQLLGHILERQYPNAGDIKSISFSDLLEWHMWPIFITIFGKANYKLFTVYTRSGAHFTHTHFFWSAHFFHILT